MFSNNVQTRNGTIWTKIHTQMIVIHDFILIILKICLKVSTLLL